MKLPVVLSSLLALLVASVFANTEKAIFTAPGATAFTDSTPALDVLQLHSLTHSDNSIRTSLKVLFPTDETPRGSDHWFLLRDLNPQQRYELRVCWAAVQPTEFWLDTYAISEVFDTPDLIQSLAQYSEDPDRTRPEPLRSSPRSKESVLFLRVRAAADFFTTNKELMSNPPPVNVDLILDPYVFNLFPRSLGPTAAYIIALAGIAWIASGRVWKFLRSNAADKTHKE